MKHQRTRETKQDFLMMDLPSCIAGRTRDGDEISASLRVVIYQLPIARVFPF